MPFDTSKGIEPAVVSVGLSPYDKPDPSFLETVGAAYRRENLIGSYLSDAKKDLSSAELNKVDLDYNVYDDISGYEQYIDRFDTAYNKKARDAIVANIDREKEQDRTLAASGFGGVALSMLAGVTDPTILVPAGAFVKAGRVGYSAARSAASVGVGAGVGAGIQEIGLQATQETRPLGESALNVGGSVILGALIGGAGSRLFSNAEWSKLSSNLEKELAEGNVPNAPDIAETMVSRLQAAGAQSVDEIKIDDLGVGGPVAAEALARATAALRVNPGVQTMLSKSVKSREVYNQLVDNTIYTTMQMEGRTLAREPGQQGAAVENLVKLYQRGAFGQWKKISDRFYRDAKKAGFRGTKEEFNIRVARAGRRGDVDELGDEFVTKSAQEARAKVFDPLLQRAITNKQLPEDITPTTALSYVTRFWNRQKLIGEEARFRNIAAEYIRNELKKLDPAELKSIRPEIDPNSRAAFEKQLNDDAYVFELIRAQRQSEKRGKYPVLNLLRTKGGVRVGSTLDQELRAMGITPKTHPGLFRKDGGLGDVDNFVLSEDEIFADNFAADAGGYVARQDVLDAINREAAGDPLLTEAQRIADESRQGVDEFLDEWYAKKGVKRDASLAEIRKRIKAATPDPDVGVARTLDDMLYESAQMREAFKARLRAKRGIPDFVSEADVDDYVDEIVEGIFRNLTGRGSRDVPEWMVPATRGPLKERTFKIPDEMIEDFLENDMELILRRYARTMGAEVELHEKFGRADMRDQIESIKEDYKKLRAEAKTQKEKDALVKDEDRDIKNIEAFRDMVRGTYRAAEEGTEWSQLTRAALAWNYVRLLGGVLLTSIADTMRLLGTHGLRATMTEGLPSLVSGVKAVKISKMDAADLGAVTEVIQHSRLATLAELQDPYRYGSKADRFISNATNIFSKATGLSYWNDMMKQVVSVMTQNRMARNVIQGANDYSKLAKYEKAYMGYLGINEDMAARIAGQLQKHGVKEGRIWGANVSKWDDDIARRAWAAALNKDVDRAIVTKGVADQPLWTRTNWGKLIMQFKTFGLASHQRVLIAGLQERPHRFAEQMVFGTAMGMMIAYLKMIERGDTERAENMLENPGMWIADGLDRTGLLSLPFEVSNTADKLSAAYGGSPVGITAAASKIAGDPSSSGTVSRYASRNVAGALGGPTVGLIQDLVSLATLPLRETRPSDVNTMIRQIPGASLPGIRPAIHIGAKPALQDMVE